MEELPESARRGLTIETLRHFGCGFIPNWTSAQSRLNGKFATSTPRLIIPSGDHYLARLIVPLENFDEKSRTYIQPKQHMGAKFPFAFDSISADVPMNIIVEGEIDAMSIWQVMHGILPVIATSGATSYKKFIELLKEKFPKDKPKFLVLLDSDATGKDAAPKLTKTLLEAGFPAVYYFLSKEESKLDANDILREQGANILAADIGDICNDAEQELREINIEKFKPPEDIEDDEKLWFIANPAVRRDFIKLRNQPYSKERHKAICLRKIQTTVADRRKNSIVKRIVQFIHINSKNYKGGISWLLVTTFVFLQWNKRLTANSLLVTTPILSTLIECRVSVVIVQNLSVS